jgi:DNA-binding transcriptional ArsR family regulator
MGEGVTLPSKKEEIQQISSALHAISHPTRLKILCFLGEQEKIVNEILEHVGSTQSNISQHVEVLRKARIIHSRRAHNRVFCSVKSAEMLPIIRKIRELFCDSEATERAETGAEIALGRTL